MDVEVGKWANYSCAVDSTEGNSFEWCLVIPGREEVRCDPPAYLRNYYRRLNNSIEIQHSYNESSKTSYIWLNVTEELDGTVVQCQHGSSGAIAYSKMSLLRVKSVSEAEVDIEDVE